MLNAEASRLVISAFVGNHTLETISRTSGYSLPSSFPSAFNQYTFFRVTNDGQRRRFVCVNDGVNSSTVSSRVTPQTFQAVIDMTTWGVAAGTYIVMQEASATSFGEVTHFARVPSNLSVSLTVPAWSTVVADFPIATQSKSESSGRDSEL